MSRVDGEESGPRGVQLTQAPQDNFLPSLSLRATGVGHHWPFRAVNPQLHQRVTGQAKPRKHNQPSQRFFSLLEHRSWVKFTTRHKILALNRAGQFPSSYMSSVTRMCLSNATAWQTSNEET